MINKEDIKKEVFDLYDDYAHNKIDRRSFIERLSLFAVGGLTVPALMSFLMPDYENKVQVKRDDERLFTDYIFYDSPNGGGQIKGQLAKPKNSKKKKWPGVIVVHENRGLNPYIEDVGRRAAVSGFISLSPDALTPLGGYPGNDDEGRTLQRQRDRNEMLEDFKAAFTYLKNHPNCTGKVGVVGFCFGGWISNMMAVQVEDLGAAVPFYGGQPAEEDVPSIQAPVLLHYGGLDERVNKGWPAYELALRENQKAYSAHLYPDANHGFHNDTTPRYDKPAAELAWERTIAFFEEHLS